MHFLAALTLYRSADGRTVVARCPDLTNYNGQGATWEDAVRDLKEHLLRCKVDLGDQIARLPPRKETP